MVCTLAVIRYNWVCPSPLADDQFKVAFSVEQLHFHDEVQTQYQWDYPAEEHESRSFFSLFISDDLQKTLARPILVIVRLSPSCKSALSDLSVKISMPHFCTNDYNMMVLSNHKSG